MTPAPDAAPLVSAVIPTYNHARFLGAAIQSALDQDYPQLEILVVDDGSTDDTRTLVATYADRVRYIWQQNGGLSAARNTGIRSAGGQAIAFLDADDAWSPRFLSTAMARLTGDPDLGAVYTGFSSIDKDGHPLPQTGVTTVPDDALFDKLVDGEFFVPSAVVARRECFDRAGLFDEALRASEDWDMWLRVARVYRFAGIPLPLVHYRIHGSNMSGNPDHMLRYQLMVVEKHFGKPDSPLDEWPRNRRRAYGAVYRYAVQGYYLTGNLASARRYLHLALETNPSLCSSVEMFYDLGCADQPLGKRTIVAPIDVERNASFVLGGLDELFTRPELPPSLRSRRRNAVGHASLAMGLLAYGTGRLDLARDYLIKALANEPRLLLRRAAVATLSKAMLGRRLLSTVKRSLGRHEHVRGHG